VVEAEFVVRAGVLEGRGAEEAVVDQKFVVGVAAVCCVNFFSGLYEGLRLATRSDEQAVYAHLLLVPRRVTF